MLKAFKQRGLFLVERDGFQTRFGCTFQIFLRIKSDNDRFARITRQFDDPFPVRCPIQKYQQRVCITRLKKIHGRGNHGRVMFGQSLRCHRQPTPEKEQDRTSLL